MNLPTPKTIELDFGIIEIYNNYLVSTIKEGTVMDLPELEQIYKVFDTYFPDKTFGFISNRKYDYSVNPICFMQHAKHPRLIGEAVMCYTDDTFTMSLFEKKFYSRPYEAFFNMADCENWINNLVVN